VELASGTPIFVRIPVILVCEGLEWCGGGAVSCHPHSLPLSEYHDQGYQGEDKKREEVHRGEHVCQWDWSEPDGAACSLQ
jgi:hypothetical protein